MANRLTDQFIRSAKASGRSTLIYWDTEINGFGLRVTPAGAKGFVFDYYAGRRRRRITIGRYPAWSVAAAKKAASELRRQVDLGQDPMGERHAQRSAPCVIDLWHHYGMNHLPRLAERAQGDQRSMWMKCILPELGTHRLTDLRRTDIVVLHRKITLERGPIRANRIIESLRKAFNLIIPDWLDHNPCVGVTKNREVQREHYLTSEELARLVVAIAEHEERTSADAITMLILTGARKSEVLGCCWNEFDLDTGVWIKPAARTKQRRIHRVPLSAPAIALLRARNSDGPFVFPGKNAQRSLTDVKKSWESICRRAGLATQVEKHDRQKRIVTDRHGASVLIWKSKFRIHDLRHSFASFLVSHGNTLPVVGALLGHSQLSTTKRYSHLYDQPLRAAVNAVGSKIAKS